MSSTHDFSTILTFLPQIILSIKKDVSTAKSLLPVFVLEIEMKMRAVKFEIVYRGAIWGKTGKT